MSRALLRGKYANECSTVARILYAVLVEITRLLGSKNWEKDSLRKSMWET